MIIPLSEKDPFFRKIRTNVIILCFNRNFRRFYAYKKQPNNNWHINAHFYCFEQVIIFLTERQVIIRTEEVVIFSFNHLSNDLLVAPSAIFKKHSTWPHAKEASEYRQNIRPLTTVLSFVRRVCCRGSIILHCAILAFFSKFLVAFISIKHSHQRLHSSFCRM